MRKLGGLSGAALGLGVALGLVVGLPAAAQQAQGGIGIATSPGSKPEVARPAPPSPSATGAVLPSALRSRLTPAHASDLAVFAELRAEAVALARTRPVDEAEQKAAIATLENVLQGDPQPLADKELLGPWRCRSIQADNLGVYAYAHFKCRITAAAGGLGFHKVTGSQRKIGDLVRLDNRRFAYLGAVYYERDAVPKGYGSGGERSEIGQLTKAGPGRFRLEIVGSRQSIEIIELVK